uniref:Uncharacterized protein n=1 Tax=Arundo donax TaxID=35708 RepID=A0A0A9HH01_ARUDO
MPPRTMTRRSCCSQIPSRTTPAPSPAPRLTDPRIAPDRPPLPVLHSSLLRGGALVRVALWTRKEPRPQ